MSKHLDYCRELEDNNNKEELYELAILNGLPVTKSMTKREMCGFFPMPRNIQEPNVKPTAAASRRARGALASRVALARASAAKRAPAGPMSREQILFRQPSRFDYGLPRPNLGKLSQEDRKRLGDKIMAGVNKHFPGTVKNQEGGYSKAQAGRYASIPEYDKQAVLNWLCKNQDAMNELYLGILGRIDDNMGLRFDRYTIEEMLDLNKDDLVDYLRQKMSQ
jgi:hypothetical protein